MRSEDVGHKITQLFIGCCQKDFGRGGQCGFVAIIHVKTQPVQVFSQQPGDHSLRGHDVRSFSALGSQCRGFSARTRYRRQPRNGSVLVEQIRRIVRRRDPTRSGRSDARVLELAVAPRRGFCEDQRWTVLSLAGFRLRKRSSGKLRH